MENQNENGFEWATRWIITFHDGSQKTVEASNFSKLKQILDDLKFADVKYDPSSIVTIK